MGMGVKQGIWCKARGMGVNVGDGCKAMGMGVKQGVQRRMVLVVNCFVFLNFLLCCYSIFDLVHSHRWLYIAYVNY